VSACARAQQTGANAITEKIPINTAFFIELPSWVELLMNARDACLLRNASDCSSAPNHTPCS
jgi:hypothetical protein